MPLVHDKEALKADIIATIQREGLTNLTEVETFIPVARATLYTEPWIDVYESIKEALMAQRIRDKVKYKQAWKKPNAAPVLQLAGFKLIADQDELERLTVNNNNNRQSGELQVTWAENRTFNGSMIEEAQVIPIPAIEQQQQITDNNTDVAG